MKMNALPLIGMTKLFRESLAAFLIGGALFFAHGVTEAQVPGILSYQGRVTVSGSSFNGNGQFKFALVNANGSSTFWSNDGSSNAGSEPSAGVTLPVASGLYSVLLGANMTTIPASVFNNADVRLRVWFNDGTNGFQLMAPDQRLAAVGYAMRADSAIAAGVATVALSVSDNVVSRDKLTDSAVSTVKIDDGAVMTAKIGDDAVTTVKIDDGAVTTAKISDDAVTAAKIANGAVTAAKIPDGSITEAKLAFSPGGSGAGVPSGVQEYVTAGTNTFTVPAGVTKIMVEIWGAGGGFSFNGGGAGGCGAYSRKTLNVTPGSQWTVAVGNGGANVDEGAAANGGDTAFTSVSNPSNTIVSQGGRGAPADYDTSIPAAQPDASADIKRPGRFRGKVVVGTVSPPIGYSSFEYGEIIQLELSSGGGWGDGSAMATPGPGMPGYVLIQW